MFLKITIVLMAISGPSYESSIPKQPGQIYNRLEVPLLDKTYLKANYDDLKSSGDRQPVVSLIQYAPLNVSPEQIKIFHKIQRNTKTNYNLIPNSPATHLPDMLYSKAYLEPRIQTDSTKMNQNVKCYSQDLSGNGLGSVHRSPGHNAIYRSLPLIVPKEKKFKSSFKKSTQMNTKYHRRTSTVIIPNTDLHVANLNQKFGKEHKLSAPNGYFHRLHLNIARVYSPGQVQHKSPVFVDAYSY